MRGRRPKLYQVKKGEGNPGKRKLNKGPSYKEKRPRCPTNLKGEARRIFRQLAPPLWEQSLLNESTIEAFLMLCRVGGMTLEAEKVVLREGFTVKTERGVRTIPELGVFQKLSAQFRLYLQEFGLTPASVQRVPAERRMKSLEDLVNRP